MTPENKARLKKYLFYISIFFATLIIAHLWYIFLYHDSDEKPWIWGSLSEAIIWDVPSLNPLIYENEINSYIMKLSYLSLMEYSPTEKKFIPSIWECETENLKYVKCFINPNLKWSDWTSITLADTVETFKTLKKYNLSPLLNQTTIEQWDNYIVFSNLVWDINFLNILNQPIVKKEILDWLNEKTVTEPFNAFTGVYSWRYKIIAQSVQESLWINELVLSRNENYPLGKQYIEKLNIKFFKNHSNIAKHQDQIKSFYDSSKILVGTIPRFETKEFSLNQYTSVFINSENIENKEFRSLIMSNIDRSEIVESLGKWYTEILNPYMTQESIDRAPTEKNIAWFLKELWYYKTSELTENVISEKENNQVKEHIESNNPDTSNIFSPLSKKYNFISQKDLLQINKDEVFANKYSLLLKWKTLDSTPEKILINDYELKGFKEWDTEFYYRIKESLNNFQEWENTYKVYFITWEEKTLVDEINIYYKKDSKELEKVKNEFETKIKEKLIQSWNLDSNVNENEVKEIEDLEKDFYYNTNKEPFTLKIFYINSEEPNKVIAEHITRKMRPLWINTEIRDISINEISEMLIGWEKQYDILISWTNLWYFPENIFPYFYSWQAKKWFNFASIRKPSLDSDLEEIKENNALIQQVKDELIKKVLDNLKEEQVVKTIYSPKMYYLIDKNVKNTTEIENLWSLNDRIHFYDWAFITSNRTIDTEKKTLINFIRFLYNIINE